MFPSFYNRNKYDVKKTCIDAGFDLSDLFLQLDDSEVKQIWNGIGAAGKWYNWLIPKTCWGLNINLPSAPHDVGYAFGQTKEEKIIADLRFRKNLRIWIQAHTKYRWLRKLRIMRARKYYYAVKYGGDKAFWDGKEEIL